MVSHCFARRFECDDIIMMWSMCLIRGARYRGILLHTQRCATTRCAVDCTTINQIKGLTTRDLKVKQSTQTIVSNFVFKHLAIFFFVHLKPIEYCLIRIRYFAISKDRVSIKIGTWFFAADFSVEPISIGRNILEHERITTFGTYFHSGFIRAAIQLSSFNFCIVPQRSNVRTHKIQNRILQMKCYELRACVFTFFLWNLKFCIEILWVPHINAAFISVPDILLGLKLHFVNSPISTVIGWFIIISFTSHNHEVNNNACQTVLNIKTSLVPYFEQSYIRDETSVSINLYHKRISVVSINKFAIAC